MLELCTKHRLVESLYIYAVTEQAKCMNLDIWYLSS